MNLIRSEEKDFLLTTLDPPRPPMRGSPPHHQLSHQHCDWRPAGPAEPTSVLQHKIQLKLRRPNGVFYNSFPGIEHTTMQTLD